MIWKVLGRQRDLNFGQGPYVASAFSSFDPSLTYQKHLTLFKMIASTIGKKEEEICNEPYPFQCIWLKIKENPDSNWFKR